MVLRDDPEAHIYITVKNARRVDTIPDWATIDGNVSQGTQFKAHGFQGNVNKTKRLVQCDACSLRGDNFALGVV